MACRRALVPSLLQPSLVTCRAAYGHSTVWQPRLQDLGSPGAPTSGRPRWVARPLPPRAVRPYSQDAPANKQWEFKDVNKFLTLKKSNPTGSKAILVDVREPAELEKGRIPTAINIPITSQPDSFHISDEEFEDKFGFVRPPRDAELVLYCKSGVRSRAAAGLAKDAGWTNVGEYSGSWLDWEANGGEVE